MRRVLSQGLLLAIVAAMICSVWVAESAPYPYGWLWVLPLIFIAVALMLYASIRSGEQVYIPDGAIAILAFIRLLLLPTLISQLDDPRYGIGIELPSTYYDRGIAFLAYESLFTTAAYCLLVRRMRHAKKAKNDPRLVSPGINVAHVLLIVVGAATVAMPAVRERYSFFTSSIDATAREIVSGYATEYDVIAQVANLARVAIPGVIAAWALRRYHRNESGSYVTAAAIGAVAVNTFYTATSRASVVIPLLAAVMVLAYLFPKNRVRVLVLAGLGLTAVTAVLTFRKSLDGSDDARLGWYVNYLSTYFLGPREYAIGVRAMERFEDRATLNVLVNDLVGNVPFLSGLIDPLDRTSQFYNWTYLNQTGLEGGGLIVPASVQGAFYAGYILGPMMCTFALVFAARAQNYLLQPNVTAFGAYVACFALVVGSFYFTNAVSNVAALFAFPILPMALLAMVARPRPKPLNAAVRAKGKTHAT
jgi:hypothetical protein